ncbi:MAG: DHH family phosphoesterase [Candidatus Cloacimonetes bacterium]|nr:DHH family phosphoesterase [Candidatus Cloacimonadota bacterium]
MSAIIYTHCDFDGAASAALVSFITGMEIFKFATPDNIRQQGVNGEDIVCDLPYISGCHLWFDHHSSNLQEVRDRGLNPDNLPGKAVVAPSAAQVIYDYYREQQDFPAYLQELVCATNIIDTMGYKSIAEWLEPAPWNIINETININSESFPAMCHHLNWLTLELRQKSMAEIVKSEKILQRYEQNLAARERELDYIRKIYSFLPEDTEQKMLVLDCSELSYVPKFNKNLALVVKPEAEYTLLIASDFNFGRKTNNLKISLSKNFLLNSDKKLGEFLEVMNIGGGHDNAAGGMIRSENKKDRLRKLHNFQLDLLDFLQS